MAMAAPLAADAAAGGAASAEGAAGGSLRPGAYSGGSTMAVDGRNRAPKPAAKKPAAGKPAAGKPAPGEQTKPDAGPDASESRGERRGLPNPGGVVREGSWVVLGFLVWVWVALPFIKNGPGGVRDVLAAKFINRTADAHEQHAQHVQNKGTS